MSNLKQVQKSEDADLEMLRNMDILLNLDVLENLEHDADLDVLSQIEDAEELANDK